MENFVNNVSFSHNINKHQESKKLAEELTSVFLGKSFEMMFGDLINGDTLLGGGKSEKIWRSMMIDEYAKEMSKTGSFPLTDSLTKQIIKMQGEKNG